jgi:hypothetical protein
MTVIFVGVLASLLFNELEELLRDNKKAELRHAFRFRRTRRSIPMLLLVGIAFALAAFEVFGVMTGALYKNGIIWIGLVRLFLLLAALAALLQIKVLKAKQVAVSRGAYALASLLGLGFFMTYLI